MPPTFDHSELSAYVDGDLPADRIAEIETSAAGDPVLRRHLDDLLADHRALRELARLERENLGEPPRKLLRLGDRLSAAIARPGPARSRRRRHRMAAAIWQQVAGLAAAAAIGWGAASWASPHDDPLASFIDEVAEVHRVTALAPAFSREASVTSIESLGRLFARRLTPPDLSDAGFALQGVDVAAIDTGPAAVFFYTDPEARRLSLVLSLDSPILDALAPDDVAPRVTTHDGLAVAYGEREGVAYALVGSIPEPNVRRLAMRASSALSN